MRGPWVGRRQWPRSGGPTRWAWALAVLGAMGLPREVAAQRPRGAADPTKAKWDRATREAAAAQIPLDQLDPAARAQVKPVLGRLSIFRRLPVRVILCDPELYGFCVRHPDVVTATWQVLGLSRICLRQIGPETYRLTDGSGTDAKARFVYRSEDLHVAYVEGACGGPLFVKPVRGRAVLVLKTGWVREPDGRYFITSRLDAFVRVDNGGLNLLAKTFQPVVGKLVDNNFTQTVGYVGCLCRTAEVNPGGVKRLATKLTSVEPPVREEFARLAEEVAERAEATERAAAATAAVGQHEPRAQ